MGFDPTQGRPSGETGGLSGMRERAILLGARLEVESQPGAGTRVSLEVPLPPPGEASRMEPSP